MPFFLFRCSSGLEEQWPENVCQTFPETDTPVTLLFAALCRPWGVGFALHCAASAVPRPPNFKRCISPSFSILSCPVLPILPAFDLVLTYILLGVSD